jgi:hypothetical protein
MPLKEFKQEVRNSTGRLDDLEMRITIEPYASVVLPDATARRLPDKPNTWEIQTTVPEGFSDVPVKLALKYCWHEGAILTEEEMERTKDLRQEQATPRSVDYEFVMGRIPRDFPVASMEIIVVLPPECAPEDARVFVERDGRHVAHQEGELRPCLKTLSTGVFALRVDYPLDGHDYQIAWKPVPEKRAAEMMPNEAPRSDFIRRARDPDGGNRLLASLRDELLAASLPRCSSLALYVPVHDGGTSLERAGCIGWYNEEITDPNAEPPRRVPVIGSQQMLARAWWGELFGLVRPADDLLALSSGFLPGEGVVFGVPIRLSLGSIRGSPWGVVRIGITPSKEDTATPEKRLEDIQQDRLSTILLSAATFLLYNALRTDYIQCSKEDKAQLQAEKPAATGNFGELLDEIGKELAAERGQESAAVKEMNAMTRPGT